MEEGTVVEEEEGVVVEEEEVVVEEMEEDAENDRIKWILWNYFCMKIIIIS